MKKRLYVWALFAVILLSATAQAAFAQSAGRARGAPSQQTYLLEFRTNVNGASVTINGQYEGTAPMTVHLQPGYYQILITAPGYSDFRKDVQLNGNTIVTAVLAAANYSLTITSNVNGANVFLNGQNVGQTPVTTTLQPGSYELRVEANGYRPYRTQINVNQSGSVNAQLQGISYSLSVTSNVNGANVFLNGRRVGQTPLTASLQPGSYELRVEANGYRPYRTQINVNQNGSVNAQLQGLLARIHIRIPDQFLNVNSQVGRGDRGRARNDIRVFVDNRRVEQDNFEVQEGNHTIRFESGSFMVQQNFHFQAGRDYTISPELSIRVN